MKTMLRLTVAAAAALAAGAAAAPAADAAAGSGPAAPAVSAPAAFGTGQAVFVQTDGLSGNQIVVYRRAADGTLSSAGVYSTGGLGGQVAGSTVDHLTSQGSLAYDAARKLLYAVNAGSDTVSVFAVDGTRLTLRQVVSSGGTFPLSITTRGDVVYVLNGLDGGSIQGFRVEGGRLAPVPSWNRGLGFDPAATATPGQVGFAADGTKLLVTTKGVGNSIDVFAVSPSGAPAAAPVVNHEGTSSPFAFVLDGRNRVVVAEAATDTAQSFAVDPDGTLTPLVTAATGQVATCWIVKAGDRVYTSNAGSASLSGFGLGPAGALTPLGNTATDKGTVDATSADGGRFVYAETGAAGIVDEFAVQANGSLTEIGSQTVPGAVGAEGIAAS